MTNREKFREVFGFSPVVSQEVCPDGFECEGLCTICPFNGEWWEREYKECFELNTEGADL